MIKVRTIIINKTMIEKFTDNYSGSVLVDTIVSHTGGSPTYVSERQSFPNILNSEFGHVICKYLDGRRQRFFLAQHNSSLMDTLLMAFVIFFELRQLHKHKKCTYNFVPKLLTRSPLCSAMP